MQKIFSVYDAKAAAYLPPFFMPTEGLAVRSFEAAVRDTSHDFHRFAADFTLFEFGSFDPTSGSFELLAAPVVVIGALQLLSKENV